MKKLTTTLLSLAMLILAMGTAWAQTIPAPTFDPASGSTITPKTQINFGIDPAINLEKDYDDMAFVLWVENDESTELTVTVEELYALMNSGIGGLSVASEVLAETAEGPKCNIAWNLEGLWRIPAIIATASGEVKVRAKLALLSEDVVFSEEVLATYTVAGEVAKPNAPVFDPAGGEVVEGSKVTMTNGYEEDEMAGMYPIYYVVNGSDEDFNVTSAMDLDNGKLKDYMRPIAIDANQTIKAATAQISVADYSVTWSDITTATYTVVAAPKPVDTAMTFTPRPTTKLTITSGASTEVYIRPKDGDDEIYYRILTVDGADQTAPITTQDQKIEKTAQGGGGRSPIKVTENMVKDGKFIVKTAALRADGTFSDEVTAIYAVEILSENFDAQLEVTPELTEFMVGKQYVVTVKALVDEATQKRWGYRPVMLKVQPVEAGILFAKVEYRFGTTGDYVVVDKDLINDVVDIELGTLSDYLAGQPIELRLTMANKKIDDAMKLQFGIATVGGLEAEVLAAKTINAPCLERPAVAPTFTPAPGFVATESVDVTLASTAGAQIYYTLDGSEPTNQSTLYESPIKIGQLTTIKAVAYKDNDYSFESEGTYSFVGIPEITPASGKVVYDSPVTIELKNTPDAKVYYTTDGSEPTAQGTLYTEPFKLQTKVVKAIAILGEKSSPVVTREYTLIPATPVASLSNKTPLPFGAEVELTCATEGAEIYYLYNSVEPLSKETGILYTKPIKIEQAGTLKAMAYYDGVAGTQLSIRYKVNHALPEFSPKAGAVPEGARVIITSKTKDANTVNDKIIHIIYTTDGTDPEPKKKGDEYTAPIEITGPMTIKAMTWATGASGIEKSEIAEATYWLEGGEAPAVEVAAPVFTPAAGTVAKGTQVGLTTTTAGADIYYTLDGSEPTAASTKFEEMIVIEENVTIKAIAIFGDNKSEVVTAAYVLEGTVIDVITPVFSPDGGEVEAGTKVTVTCATEGAKIYYTTDGTEPTAESAEYKEAITIDKAMTLKAIAILGEFKSSVATAEYTVKAAEVIEVATPTFDPAAGEVTKGTKVSIACATEGATIYYTVDGSEPTSAATEYKEAISIDSNLTVKAIAVKDEVKSEVATAAYTVKVSNEGLELAGVNLYPNPSNGQFHIELPVPARVEVFGSNGVLRQRVEAGAGLLTLTVDHSGVYFIRITGEGRTTVKRVVVR